MKTQWPLPQDLQVANTQLDRQLDQKGWPGCLTCMQLYKKPFTYSVNSDVQARYYKSYIIDIGTPLCNWNPQFAVHVPTIRHGEHQRSEIQNTSFLFCERCRARQLEMVGTGVPLKSHPLFLWNLHFKSGIETYFLFVFNVSNGINQYF